MPAYATSLPLEQICPCKAAPAHASCRAERQYATFSATDACNYCVNIYDGGDTLSIVTDVGAHGTHVAGIAAACMRHDGDAGAAVTAPFDGVAPGAQIVSCKIGDTRVSGMETGPGLSRALAAVLENGCDVINMSYGEPTMTPDEGRIVDLINVRRSFTPLLALPLRQCMDLVRGGAAEAIGRADLYRT